MPYNNALVSENFWKLFFQNPENPHKHWVFWHFQKVCPYLTQADDLGRVVIPKEIRRTMRIREGDPSHTTLTPFDKFCMAIHSVVDRYKETAE